jgi:hypothetical protein
MTLIDTKFKMSQQDVDTNSPSVESGSCLVAHLIKPICSCPCEDTLDTEDYQTHFSKTCIYYTMYLA